MKFSKILLSSVVLLSGFAHLNGADDGAGEKFVIFSPDEIIQVSNFDQWATDANKIEAVLASGVSPDIKNAEGFPAIFYAIRSGDWLALHLFLLNNANVNITDGHGFTPLMMAVAAKDVSKIEYLISRGAEINKMNNENETALDIARRIDTAYADEGSNLANVIQESKSAV